MQIVIPRASLEEHQACSAYLTSPEWNEKEQALVYSDWTKTVARLLTTPMGIGHLEWLVTHQLVPMTALEFQKAKKALFPRFFAGPAAAAPAPKPAPEPARPAGASSLIYGRVFGGSHG